MRGKKTNPGKYGFEASWFELKKKIDSARLLCRLGLVLNMGSLISLHSKLFFLYPGQKTGWKQTSV